MANDGDGAVYPVPGASARLIAPELRAALDRFPRVVLTEEAVLAGRSGTECAPLPAGRTPELASVTCERRLIAGPAGAPDVAILLYTPPGTGPEAGRPAILHLHGGGFVRGAPETNDHANRQTALEQGCVIISVAYRLAPEWRFPAALEDAHAALLWLHENAAALGVDRNHIALAGDSAGGGLVAVLALVARERGDTPIAFQLLDSPMLDDRTGSTSDPHPYCGEYVLTPEASRFYWSAYLGTPPGGADVPAHAAPARAVDLSGLPPAFIIVGGLDLLLEEAMDYARRLIRSGVNAELHVIPGAYHAFGIAGEAAPQVRTTAALRREALHRAFRTAPSSSL